MSWLETGSPCNADQHRKGLRQDSRDVAPGTGETVYRVELGTVVMAP